MGSLLKITDVEKLQNEINRAVASFDKIPGVYVSLNKTQKSIEEVFKKNKISTARIFFIDCVTSEQKKDDVLHVNPRDLNRLSAAISLFMKEIKGDKFLIVDALSTLLIYNDEKAVAAFVKEITEYSQKDVHVVALSPKTKGEELLGKIFNFFDKVEKR